MSVNHVMHANYKMEEDVRSCNCTQCIRVGKLLKIQNMDLNGGGEPSLVKERKVTTIAPMIPNRSFDIVPIDMP